MDISQMLVTLFAWLVVASTHAQDTAATSNSQPLVDAFAKIIEQAIPREYEKRKDWGRTKNITVGLRNDGFKIHRRKKAVKHGTWKRYRIRLVEPENTLRVRIENLRPGEEGRMAFTLRLNAALDLWARAKVYRYGVHVIALEAEGDAKIDLEIDCEIGLQLQTQDGRPGVALHPRLTAARLDIAEFHLHRVSNAHGPIVRELGEELPRLIESELQGPKLLAKLNRALEKKRDRLEFGVGDWLPGK